MIRGIISSTCFTSLILASLVLSGEMFTSAFVFRNEVSGITGRLNVNAPLSASVESLNPVDIVACYGRLADRAYVLPNDEVEGTAASGYEFGVLEAGRPKWLCTYEERSGKTQGGGNEIQHVPNWRQRLFGADGVLADRDALREAITSEGIKFQMPLAAPSGTFAAKGPITNEVVIDALWIILGGLDVDGPLSSEDASSALRAAAAKHGSDTEDHLTYAIFEKAFVAME